MFTESLLLAVISALAGLTVAWWGSRLLLALVADGAASLAIDVRLDLPVLAFTIVVTIAAVALFGLAPALRATRVDLATVMRATGRSLTGGLGARGNRFPLGKLLVAGQVGLSVVLLAGAALLVRDLRSVQSVDVGLDRDHLVIVDVDAVGRGYVDDRRAPCPGGTASSRLGADGNEGRRWRRPACRSDCLGPSPGRGETMTADTSR